MRKNRNIIVYLIVIIAPLCWAGDVVLAKGVSKLIPPFSLAFWRWLTTFLFLLPFTWKHLKKDWLIVKNSWKLLFLLSFLGMSAFIALIYTAVKTTTAINSALIQTAMPGAIVLFCLLLYKEKVTFIQLIGLSLCFIGAAHVVLQGKLSNIIEMSFVRGDVLMILASVMYGLYSALLQKVPSMHPLSFLTFTSGAATIGLLPTYLYEIISIGPFVVNLRSISGILYVALFPSIIAYLCWNKGIATIGANKTGILISLIPIFASILAILFLDETVKSFHIIGMLIISAGMFVFNKNFNRIH